MAEDILQRMRIVNNNETLDFSDGIYNDALDLLEDKFLQIKNMTLSEAGIFASI